MMTSMKIEKAQQFGYSFWGILFIRGHKRLSITATILITNANLLCSIRLIVVLYTVNSKGVSFK